MPRPLSMLGRGFDPWHTFVESVPMLVQRAREIRLDDDETNSYRIKVGCMALSTSLDGSEMGMFAGGNTKITKAHGKVCAETRAIRRARRAGAGNIIGLVIVGDLQPDDGTGVFSPTLHCCEECRPNNLARFCNDDTLVMTVLPDSDNFQLHTAAELIDIHDAAAGGVEIAQQPLFHDPGLLKWDRNRVTYGSRLVQRQLTNVNAMITGDDRSFVVSAAREAITGTPSVI